VNEYKVSSKEMSMSETSEVKSLRQSIEQDEQTLTSLKKEENEVIEHIASKGFAAATSRERLMSEAQVVEERLHKNKKRLAVLER
jgi:hypothetical protein